MVKHMQVSQIMDQIRLEEISRQSIRISKVLETSVTWGKGPLSVITDKGLSVFQFSYDLSLWDKNIALSETAIPSPKTGPASKLLAAATRGQVINNLMVNQMIIDPVFWPHNDELVKELAAVTAHQYSPPEFIFNNDCVLATLTNIGNINLFARKRHCWTDVLDLSASLDNTLDLKAELDFGNSEKILDPLRQASSALQSCAFCWGSHDDPSNKSCFFVTAQRNGDILFWKLIKEKDSLKAEFLTRQNVETSEIVSIYWIPRTDLTFLLIYSNILGQLHTLECTKAKESVTVTKRNILWKHQDRMIVKILKHKSSKDGYLQCIFAKHRHLIIQTINNSGELISQFYSNVNDNKITSIFQFKGDFYVCTVNCCVYKIIITGGNYNISAEFVPIIFKDTYLMHNLYGIAVSSNEALWALAMISRQVNNRKSPQCLNIVLFSPENDRNTLAQLLCNPTRSLREMWDCIELQRYKTVKSKRLPEYSKMFSEAQTEPYILKLYMIFLNLQENLESICRSTNKDLLPEKSSVTVKELLLFQHAITLVQNLSSKFKMFNNLSEFDEETFAGAKHYIGYYCLKYKCDIKEILAPEILQRELKYHSEWMCELCGEYLEGFLCKNGHFNSYCSLTFTLISNSQYLSCCRCKATARFELYPDNPTCIFCDLHLVMS